MAPSYIAAIVAVLFGGQSLLGLDFAPEMLTAAVTVIVGIVVAIRQIASGRSTALGSRPEGFNA